MPSRSTLRLLTLVVLALTATLAGCQTTGKSTNTGTGSGTTANPSGGSGAWGGKY